MNLTKIGVNYKATEDFLDQLRSFIIDRYVEIYNCNPLDEIDFESTTETNEYNELLYMLQACYENDNTL